MAKPPKSSTTELRDVAGLGERAYERVAVDLDSATMRHFCAVRSPCAERPLSRECWRSRHDVWAARQGRSWAR